jgi:hypothetical protein
LTDTASLLPPATEWLRTWAYQVPALEREGWRVSHAFLGRPSELLFGAEYVDCVMVREVADA